jgi:hypothetical protein
MEDKIKERNGRIGVYEERLNIIEEKLNGILILKNPSRSSQKQLEKILKKTKQTELIITDINEKENGLLMKDLKLKLNIKSIKKLTSSKPDKNGMIVIELVSKGQLIL